MSAKDKNGIDLCEGDYVKIVVPVTAVQDGEVEVFIAGATIKVLSKNTEAVVFDPKNFPAGYGRSVEERTDAFGPPLSGGRGKIS